MSKYLVAVLLLLAFMFSWDRALAANKSPPQAELLREVEALLFLKSLPKQWSASSSYDCKTYEDKNIDRLARPFVMLAASFLKGFTEMHGKVTITSAHRNQEEQKCVCAGEKGLCAGRGSYGKKNKDGTPYGGTGLGSRHSTGLAIDVRAGTAEDEEYRCMHEFADRNPIYGVHFPLGMRDRPHLEPTGQWGLRAYLKIVVSTTVKSTPLVKCKSIERMYTRTWDD